MAMPSTISWSGNVYPVADCWSMRGRRYFVLHRIGNLDREKYFGFNPSAGPGGDVCMLHRLHLDPACRQYLRVLRRVCSGNRNVLKILDHDWRGATLQLVTPWIHGESLAKRLARARTHARLWPSPIMAFHLVRKLAHGLHQFSHRETIVHGDIKPANLILDHNNLVIADFGSAWTMENACLRLTGDGFSESYASPEQLLGDKRVDFRTDIFSATVVLYELLTRRLPYAGYSAKAALPEFRPEMESTLRPPGDGHPDRHRLPEFFWRKVDAVVTKGLALDPDRRFGTTREWIRHLNDIDAELKLKSSDGLLVSVLDRVVNWFFRVPGKPSNRDAAT